MKSLKVAGLALIALLAISAIGASGASAASYKCITKGKCFITADTVTNQVFQTTAAKVSCTKVEGQGSFEDGATSLTATGIKYSGCTVAGQAATVNMNECDYNFGEPTNAASPFTIGTITIECPTGKEIVVTATASGCTLKIKPQKTTGTTAAKNAGTEAEMDVTLAANVPNVTATGSNGICGTGATTATYTGEITVTGFTTAEHKVRTGVTIG